MNDRQIDAVLDRFTVPPLPAGFADRIVAAAEHRTASLPDRRPPRDKIGGWRRRGAVLGGSAALGLLSAAAAAAGLFGEPARRAVREVPVVGTIIARVVPESAQPIRASASAPQPQIFAERTTQAASSPDAQPGGSEEIVRRIVERIEEQRKQRAELGQSRRPVPPQVVAQAIRHLPPDQRETVVQRLREIRDERRAAAWAVMSEEERTAVANRIELRRILREQRRLRLLDETRTSVETGEAPVPAATDGETPLDAGEANETPSENDKSTSPIIAE